MPDVPAQGGDGRQDGGARQQGSKTAILTSINRLLSRGGIVVDTFYSYLIFFFYIFCRTHFDLTSPADCRVGPGDGNATDGAGGVAEEKVHFIYTHFMTIHLLTCSCYAPVSSIFTWVGWVQDIFDIVLIAGENLNYVVDLMRKDKGVNIRKGLNTRLSFLHEE